MLTLEHDAFAPSSVTNQILRLSTIVIVAFVLIGKEEYFPSSTRIFFSIPLAKERSMAFMEVTDDFIDSILDIASILIRIYLLLSRSNCMNF